MLSDIDVLIVGSGPSGISAAWPLVHGGLSVAIVDGGGNSAVRSLAADRSPLKTLRECAGDGGHRHLLGDDLSALQEEGTLSPKMRFAAPRGFTDDFTKCNHLIQAGDFELVGALARGGLSNVWGNAVSCFDDRDLAGTSLTRQALTPSYIRVAQRIGISGGGLGDPLGAFHGTDVPLMPAMPLSPLMNGLLDKSFRQPSGTGIIVGHARNAVITQDLGERHACRQDNACLWGCAAGSTYNSSEDLQALLKHPNCRYVGQTVVRSLSRVSSGGTAAGWAVDAYERQTGKPLQFSSRAVMLACGPLPTTRLVLSLLNRHNEALPLLNTPCFASIYLAPRHISDPLPETGFAMAQLGVCAPLQGGSYCYGSLYSADGISASDLMEGLPLTRPGAAELTRFLLPALVIFLGYLPGTFSENRVTLRQNENGDDELHVGGGWTYPARAEVRRVTRQLSGYFRKLGLVGLPAAQRYYRAGAEAHSGGTLALSGIADANGAIRDCPGLYAVDASVIPCFPAKHPTFTIMANADRIAHELLNAFSFAR